MITAKDVLSLCELRSWQPPKPPGPPPDPEPSREPKKRRELGRTTAAELKNIPSLFSFYKEEYGTRRPKIIVIESEVFHYPFEAYEMGSWQIIGTYKDGNLVKRTSSNHPSGWKYGDVVSIQSDEWYFECIKGNVNLAYLYFHPDQTSRVQSQIDIIT